MAAVTITAFGLAWTSVRTHDVARASRAHPPARAGPAVPRAPSRPRGGRVLRPGAAVAHGRQRGEPGARVRRVPRRRHRGRRDRRHRARPARRRRGGVAGPGSPPHPAVLRRRSARDDVPGRLISSLPEAGLSLPEAEAVGRDGVTRKPSCSAMRQLDQSTTTVRTRSASSTEGSGPSAAGLSGRNGGGKIHASRRCARWASTRGVADTPLVGGNRGDGRGRSRGRVGPQHPPKPQRVGCARRQRAHHRQRGDRAPHEQHRALRRSSRRVASACRAPPMARGAMGAP